MIKSSKVMPYVLIFPALCIVGLLTFWPIGYSIYISFTDLYLLRSPIPKFIGLENFRTLFKSNEFLRSLSNSIIWVVGSNVCHFGLGLGFALLMIYITLPSIKSLVGTILLLGIAWTFNDITMIWLLTEGGPGFDSSVYGLFVYKNAFQFYRFGLASAGGLVGFVFILILSVIYLRRVQID
jgi:ABC-type sugar transport system permease subunit